MVLVAAMALAACGSDGDGDQADPPGTTAAGGAGPSEEQELEVATAYADGVLAAYDESIAGAEDLRAALDALVAGPTDATLGAAKEAWLVARDAYGPTEAFRFYDGPIDDPEDGPEGQVNAWPMDEAHVDYVEGNPGAGIVNMAAEFPEITTDVLESANEEGGETNISTGWHAIEFLLWGQDLSEDGPGARPVSDYTTAPNAARRATYLTLLADLLVEDLTGVRDQWDSDGGAYRTEFLADPHAALSSIVRGIGALNTGELGGERMAVAYETKDQEDEHSCFSDNTTADVRNNLLGVQMVYTGGYPGASGPSVSGLVAELDPDLDATLREQLGASIALVDDWPTTFDRMISGEDDGQGRTAFLATVTAIEDQGTTLAQVADLLGIQVNFEV
ncbi:MAG: iron-regulated protein [Acidimicrobiia bacterium]|nr:iron-regulated protein [Acidimicrobiia bacterium]